MTLQLGYLATDTLGKLVPRTDTLRMVNKINRQRRLAMAEEARKEKEKERKNGLKKEIHWLLKPNS